VLVEAIGKALDAMSLGRKRLLHSLRLPRAAAITMKVAVS
jgi:hypothetical protein